MDMGMCLSKHEHPENNPPPTGRSTRDLLHNRLCQMHGDSAGRHHAGFAGFEGRAITSYSVLLYFITRGLLTVERLRNNERRGSQTLFVTVICSYVDDPLNGSVLKYTCFSHM